MTGIHICWIKRTKTETCSDDMDMPPSHTEDDESVNGLHALCSTETTIYKPRQVQGQRVQNPDCDRCGFQVRSSAKAASLLSNDLHLHHIQGFNNSSNGTVDFVCWRWPSCCFGLAEVWIFQLFRLSSITTPLACPRSTSTGSAARREQVLKDRSHSICPHSHSQHRWHAFYNLHSFY